MILKIIDFFEQRTRGKDKPTAKQQAAQQQQRLDQAVDKIEANASQAKLKRVELTEALDAERATTIALKKCLGS